MEIDIGFLAHLDQLNNNFAILVFDVEEGMNDVFVTHIRLLIQRYPLVPIWFTKFIPAENFEAPDPPQSLVAATDNSTVVAKKLENALAVDTGIVAGLQTTNIVVAGVYHDSCIRATMVAANDYGLTAVSCDSIVGGPRDATQWRSDNAWIHWYHL